MMVSEHTGLSLTISDLSVHFPGLSAPALSIKALQLPAANSLAITGASGSGKSTFVNSITGLSPIDSGSIYWGETEFNRLNSFKRDAFRARTIGLVMQDFHLFVGLSALANVLLPVKLRRRLHEEDRQRALNLLAQVGLSRAQQPVETLSRGEMQRVAIARALLSKPSVVVADEPTASLDQKNGHDVGELLVSLVAAQRATLIVITHDLQLAGRLERHIEFEGGKITRDSKRDGA